MLKMTKTTHHFSGRNSYNDTPLHEAALRGQEEAALVLIDEFGCDTSIRRFLMAGLYCTVHVARW